MPKITSITATNAAANADLLVITANTSGTAVTRTINVATLATAVQVSTPVISQLNTSEGNVVSNAQSFAISFVGSNNIHTSATGNTITLSANLSNFQNTISSVVTPDGTINSSNSQGFNLNFAQSNGILISATGNTATVTFDPATINTLTDVTAPAYSTEGELPTASSNFNGHTVVAGSSLYHGAGDVFIKDINVNNSADELKSHIKFTLSANSGAWNVSGGGAQGTDDETLYLYRGFTYQFDNPVHSSHPLQIRVSDGGAAYTNGVSNNAAGNTTYWTVPMNAANVFYQCTNHSSMLGQLIIV